MAIRTTATAVKKIIETNSSIVVIDADLDPFIETANNLVDQCCTGDAGPATAYSDATLELIERWLAAHFYAIRDTRRSKEVADEVSESYMYRLGLNLNVTLWGQQALAIDTNGGLADVSKRAEEGNKKPSGIGVSYLGKDPRTTTLNASGY